MGTTVRISANFKQLGSARETEQGNIIHRICWWSRSGRAQVHYACCAACFDWLWYSSRDDVWFSTLNKTENGLGQKWNISIRNQRALDHDSIKRHNEASEDEFEFGKEEIDGGYREEVWNHWRTWCMDHSDKNRKTRKTTIKRGPSWKYIAYRTSTTHQGTYRPHQKDRNHATRYWTSHTGKSTKIFAYHFSFQCQSSVLKESGDLLTTIMDTVDMTRSVSETSQEMTMTLARLSSQQLLVGLVTIDDGGPFCDWKVRTSASHSVLCARRKTHFSIWQRRQVHQESHLCWNFGCREIQEDSVRRGEETLSDVVILNEISPVRTCFKYMTCCGRQHMSKNLCIETWCTTHLQIVISLDTLCCSSEWRSIHRLVGGDCFWEVTFSESSLVVYTILYDYAHELCTFTSRDREMWTH